MELHSKQALLSAVRAAEKPVALLVGSPLSVEGDCGVPGIGPMLALIRDEVRARAASELARFETEIDGKTGALAYQSAMGWLQANLSQDAVNRVVRHAVLKARPRLPAGADPFLGDGEPSEWYIPRGTQDLARLVCGTNPKYHGPILTTNFDPLLSLAIRKVGGRVTRRVLDADGNLPRDVEDDPDVRTVVHLHGFWRGSDTLHTPTQLRCLRPKLHASLQRLLRRHTLVVAAYGGWDDAFTTSFADLLNEDQAELDVLWCFYQDNLMLIDRDHKTLLDRVTPAIIRGRFRAYGGIDCHCLFSELTPTLSLATPLPDAPPPLDGWQVIDPEFLSGLSDLTPTEVLRYFDGAVPTWRHAVSADIPQRTAVRELITQLETARAAGEPCTLTVILAASGEGKSTLLLQVAAKLAQTGEWAVAWRPSPDVGLDAEQAVGLDRGRMWILLTDDAENLVEAIHASARRLHELGQRDVHFLIAARDTDRRAAQADECSWAAVLHRVDIRLRGVSHEDARLIVSAWAAYGEPGLRALATVRDEGKRINRFEEAVRDTAAQHGEGSFFGGLLAARLGEAGLRAHVRELLRRLRGIEVEGSASSLFDALLYAAACHAVGIPGVDENVLADLLNIPRNRVHSRVVRPLGDEAAAVRTARYILTRHQRVAAAVLIEATAGFGIDLAEVWDDLVSQTVRTSRQVFVGPLSYSPIMHAGPRLQLKLPDQIPEPTRAEIAIVAAQASVNANFDRLDCLVDLGKTYRAAGRNAEAVQVFRDNLASVCTKVDYSENCRGYFHEWGVCEGKYQSGVNGGAASAWLQGLALSDYLRASHITLDQTKFGCAGLGVAFKKLARKHAGDAFTRALRTVAFIGLLTHPDPKVEHYLQKHDRMATALGAPQPANTEESIAWLEEGVKAAWPLIADDFLRNLALPEDVTFRAFRVVLVEL